MFFSHGTADSRGVLVAVKNELEYSSELRPVST